MFGEIPFAAEFQMNSPVQRSDSLPISRVGFVDVQSTRVEVNDGSRLAPAENTRSLSPIECTDASSRLSSSGELALQALLERSERLLEAQRSVQDFHRQTEVLARLSEAGVETIKRMSQVGGA